MSEATEQRTIWLNRYSVAERRKLAYVIARRTIEDNEFAVHDLARKVSCGAETPFEYGWTLETMDEFFRSS